MAPKERFRGNCQLALAGTWQASLGIPPNLANRHLLELAGVFQATVIELADSSYLTVTAIGKFLLGDIYWQAPS